MESEEGTTEITTKMTVENQDLGFLQQSVGVFMAEYGWYLLFLCVGVYLLIQHVSKRRTSPEMGGSTHVTAEDPVSVVRRQEALEASRRRLQEELNAKAAQFKERQQALEEEKRRQKIEMWESMKEGKSYKGNAKIAHQNTEEASSSAVLKPRTDKKPLRNSGFNPLTGEGGGTCAWRPGRRGPSAGG
ncbi:selenoprotein S isoform X1 [Megalops cyprinoides]|uniref:selenoprotein S isoform X1 n=1 Tax=Megalops cyprinoides TaxID=118141 RepID=UPI001863AD27|nr:selenoprotein S isoform X1 [Megalops cyprinoides]